MNQDFKKYIKLLLIFGIPFWLLAISYFVFDPFHVLRNYQEYGSNYLKTYNRNRISTQTFLNYNPKYHFESFIFGSSRSSAFRTSAWSKYIGDPNPYHFDAFNDNISGIRGKMQFIENQGNKIKNALIVIDNDTFSEQYDDESDIVHMKDCMWSGRNPLMYHLEFFKAFFKKKYFISFFDLKINKTYRPWMEEFFKFKYYYEAPSNDFYFPENEEGIQKDSVKYYANPDFKKRYWKPEPYDKTINEEHLKELKIIKEILDRNKSKYKIVISPLFNQIDYSPIDLEVLNIYFGKENVYNFSGINKYTNDIANYYEMSHYKPQLGNILMKEMYQKEVKAN